MNIFVLDRDPYVAASYHCDKHVRKMILESVQLLGNSHWEHNTFQRLLVYGRSHHNHPCSKWVLESRANYVWLLRLLNGLLHEYRFRWDKCHKASEEYLILQNAPPQLPDVPMTPFARAFGEWRLALNVAEEFRSDTVAAYREYYRIAKKDILSYTRREVPSWI